MTRSRMRTGLVAGWLVLFGAAAYSSAAPTVDDMLKFSPKQDGIAYTTPTDAERSSCKVEAVRGQGHGAGWLLRDPKGQPLRRYYDSRYDGKAKTGIDTWSYYKDGVEVYREVDSNFDGRVDQYRWINAGGCKWGVDLNQDGKIDAWKVISPEEVSQEALHAVVKRDFARLQALLLTDADIKALELPAAEATRVRESLRKAQAKFAETCAKLPAMTDAHWDHLELAAPQCLPAENNGPKVDLIRHNGAVVYYQLKDEAKGLQLGEMIQVGATWRLIDAPAPGSLLRTPDDQAGGIVMNKEMEALYKELGEIDKQAPGEGAKGPEQHRHNLKRAEVLDKMIAQVAKLDPKEYKADDRDQWIRQEADCLGVAVQYSSSGDKTAAQKLAALKAKVAKDQGETSSLAGYVVYCEVMAEYNARSANTKEDQQKVQKDLVEKLAKFVQDYSHADNTADALMQLGMLSELLGEETQARKWYEMFVKGYSSHAQAGKMKGAQTRLELDGKEMALAGALLNGGSFDIKSLKGKVVAVYYWASWNAQCASDMEKLKKLRDSYASKGVEVVCVILDDASAAAKGFLAGKSAPAIQIFESGGLAGKLGEQYGIMVLPTMFLVGKDGKVISHAAQVNNLEDDIKKALN